MKQNVTISLDRDLVAEARKQAAEEHTTLNAMLRDLLEEKVRAKARRKEAVKKILELSRKTKARIDMSDWKREDAYAERLRWPRS